MHAGAQHESDCTCSDRRGGARSGARSGAARRRDANTSTVAGTPAGRGSSTHARAGGECVGTTRTYAAFTAAKVFMSRT